MSTVQIWRYWVPNQRPQEGWGVLFLDSVGCFAALSDYGHFSHRWPMAGMSKGVGLRQFLLGCDNGYLLGKFAPEREYDGDSTVEEIKREIIRYRRSHSAPSESEKSRDQAREMWDSLTRSDIAESSHALGEWWPLHGEDLPFIPTECCQTMPNPQAVAFLERCWPRLRECIRAELAAEQGAAQRAEEQT